MATSSPDPAYAAGIRAVPRPLIDDPPRCKGRLATDGRVSIVMILGAYRAAPQGRRVHFPLRA